MNLEAGQNVVYGTSGVCRVDGIEVKSFDGIHKNKYCKLIPLGSGNSAYYIPVDTVEQKLRSLFTKEQVYDIIDHIPEEKQEWCTDKNRRKVIFSETIKSEDYSKMISMIMLQYAHKKIGKRLSPTDEKVMQTAENMVYKEFATVLEIGVNEVADFIKNRISLRG